MPKTWVIEEFPSRTGRIHRYVIAEKIWASVWEYYANHATSTEPYYTAGPHGKKHYHDLDIAKKEAIKRLVTDIKRDIRIRQQLLGELQEML